MKKLRVEEKVYLVSATAAVIQAIEGLSDETLRATIANPDRKEYIPAFDGDYEYYTIRIELAEKEFTLTVQIFGTTIADILISE